MNKEEIQEAIKIIREPITVHNEMYHYFDQENYDKLQRVYDNCQWFINNQEQIMQNAIDNKKKIDQLTNNWNELEELIDAEKTRLAKECSHTYEDSLGKTKYVNEDIFNELNNILDKMKEIKENNDDNDKNYEKQ